MAKKPEAENKPGKRVFMKTGIAGFDQLFENGIPWGSNVLIAGGAGSGKTIMCLQIIKNAVSQGKRCVYMSFEEAESRLKEHMEDFGWDVKGMEKSGRLLIKRFSSFDISKSMDVMMAKERGELLINIKPLIIPHGFSPDIIVLDSLSAISTASLTTRTASTIALQRPSIVNPVYGSFTGRLLYVGSKNCQSP